MCCGRGGGGGGGVKGANTSHLHDHLMMISMDGSSSSPSTTTSNNNNNINIADHHDYSSDHPHLFMRSTRAQGGGESSEGPSSGNAMVVSLQREHMFDKVVTPSDVGKLNRLVIPKQHAEKYFPLDSSTNEKGLLLNFEDRNGKPWRFRYSYWNSSQSYVMTKGWSRFVKEKKLDAGDIVSFQRGLGELGKDRLFIDWRRRPDAPPPPLNPLHYHHHHHPSIPTLSVPPLPPHHHHQFSFHPWNHPFYLQNQHPPSRDPYSHLLQLNSSINNTTQQYTLYESHHLLNSSRGGGYGYGSSVKMGNPCSGSVIYLNRSATAGAAERVGGVGMGMRRVQVQKGSGSSLIRGIFHEKEDEDEDEPMVFESVPVVQGQAAAKRLRLFGVNMDCPISEECDDPDDQCDILSSTAVPRIMPGPSQSNYSSSSSSSISPLQLNLRPHNVTAPHTTNATQMVLQTMPTDLLNKGKASLSLDLDM